jgi:hypothetical protein
MTTTTIAETDAAMIAITIDEAGEDEEAEIDATTIDADAAGVAIDLASIFSELFQYSCRTVCMTF